MRIINLFLVGIFIPVFSFATANCWKMKSPDNKIAVVLEQKVNGNGKPVLMYSIELYKDTTIINIIQKSVLGIERKDQSFVDNLVFLEKTETKTIDESYQMMIGRQTNFRNYANETSFSFINSQGSLMRIDFRVYNDGVAFRYVFPELSKKTYTIKKEQTTFKLSTDGRAWIQPYDKPTKWTPGYEKYYENAIEIGSPSPNIEGWAFPALFETQNVWALVTESNVTPNYCSCRLEQDATNGMYKIRFPEAKDGEGTGKVLPASKLPWVMPWRTIIVGTTLQDIFNSTMVHNLSDERLQQDFSWVKPGKSSWSWLTDNDSPKNFETLKKHVDLSASMHWEYCLVDANWDIMKGGNIKQLVDYANSKKVGILMWYNSGGKHNKISERPRNIISNKKRCADEFSKLKSWGVKGVKIDFWQSDKQNMMALYHEVLTLAAKNQLLVNLHGCTLPRGCSRTYPNLLTLEAVKGEEAYLFDSEYPAKAPVQNSILPFTRNVVGPMDYTPVVFSNLKNEHFTTSVHELALSVVFNTGLLHFADNEKTYNVLPDFVKDFLKEVPVVFDETKLIEGYPGDYVLIAARKENNWYLAGINSKKDKKTMTISCDFLNEGNYVIKKITDNVLSLESKFNHEENIITQQSSFSIDFLPYGGFVAQILLK